MAAQQIRIHSALNSSFEIFVSTKMIIEASKDLTIEPWKNPIYLNHFKDMENQWEKVQDFHWIKSE